MVVDRQRFDAIQIRPEPAFYFNADPELGPTLMFSVQNRTAGRLLKYFKDLLVKYVGKIMSKKFVYFKVLSGKKLFRIWQNDADLTKIDSDTQHWFQCKDLVSFVK